jgi:hypothetical protein
MPSNEREVFDYLTSNDSTTSEEDFLTFAVFAFERREWMAQFEKSHSRPPTQEDIDRWISELSDWQFAQMRSHAAGMFDAAARAYLKDEIEEASNKARDAEIITQIKAATGGFWRQLGLALITAILAPLIIGAMIVSANYYSHFFPTPSDVSNKVQPGESGPQPH